MRKLAIILQFFLLAQVANSQEVCEKKEDVEDFNDISSIAKCPVVGNLEDNETNLKPEVAVLSSRHRHKRRYTSRNNSRNNYINRKTPVSHSIRSPKLNDIKENISAINNALEEKLVSKENTIVRKKEKLVSKEVSFSEVENIPRFRSCSGNSLDMFDCFNHEMQKHLIENIKYPEEALERGIHGDVWVSFVITKSGSLENIIVTGPENSEMLEKEAIRVISTLPPFIPGKENNENVNVSYTFPISFNY